jgi:hypothetical protein
VIIGDYVYYVLGNGNRVKAYCDDTGVEMEVVNRKDGRVDRVYLPFRNYFQPTQCSPGAPTWYQHIDHGRWYFSQTYSHVLPKVSDYRNLANAMENYIKMFDSR